MVPPCRHFTPSLVEFRDKNKKDFESICIFGPLIQGPTGLHEEIQDEMVYHPPWQ